MKSETLGWQRLDSINICAILIVCGLAALVRWGKLNSLVHEDPAMWLFQLDRVAAGQLPYRDFSWNYPPLAAFVLGFVLRWFGVAFATVQASLDVLSFGIALVAYWLVRYLLPRPLHAAVIGLLVVASATAQTKFTLFSLLTYSPSLQFSTLGMLMLMIGGVRYLRSGTIDPMNWALFVLGAYIALMSKPESLAATGVGLGVLAVLDRGLWFQGRTFGSWIRRYSCMALACLAPGFVTYVLVARAVGAANLKEGMTGYGLATFACPWWPTGLGVFGSLAALGEAAFLAAAFLFPVRHKLPDAMRVQYRKVLIAAPPGLLVALAYYWYLNREMWASSAALPRKAIEFASSLLSTSPVLLPVMWTAICYTIWLSIQIWRRPSLNPGSREMLFLLSMPVFTSLRGLFGTTLEPKTEVSAICYPFFFLLGPYLLWIYLSHAEPALSGRTAVTILICFCLGYAAIRVVGAWQLISNRDYTTLSTRAGDVRLYQNDGSRDIYEYSVSHTAPGDYLLDIPYGGGINFAARLPSPAFTTQFQQLRMPVVYQQKDLAEVASNRPALVLADAAPNFGTLYGVEGNLECPCPRLVWKPDRPSSDPQIRFPIVTFVQENYHVVARIQNKLLLAP